MLSEMIQRYGPTTMLIVVAVLLWEGVNLGIGVLQSFNSQRFDALGGRLGRLEGRLETRFDGLEAYLETRLRGIEQGQVTLRKRMGLVGNKVDSIGIQVEEMAGDVSAAPEVARPAG